MTARDISLEERLAVSVDRLAAAKRQAENLREKSLAHFPNDPGALSGLSRKRNPNKDSARWNAYDREAAAFAQLPALEQNVKAIEAAIAERDRPRLTRDDVAGAEAVFVQYTGWRSVRRVNAKTVSVDSGFSWADLVPFDKILRVRK